MLNAEIIWLFKIVVIFHSVHFTSPKVQCEGKGICIQVINFVKWCKITWKCTKEALNAHLWCISFSLCMRLCVSGCRSTKIKMDISETVRKTFDYLNDPFFDFLKFEFSLDSIRGLFIFVSIFCATLSRSIIQLLMILLKCISKFAST